jgi:zeaxanthin glucosyltransferase
VTRVLVITIPEMGHYRPMLGPIDALQDRGVEVLVASACDVVAELEACGVRRALVPNGAPPPADDLRGEKLARLIADPASLRGWIRRLLVELPSENIEPMRTIIRDVRPDVIAVDTMSYDGAIAAELENVPWVGWATSLNPVVPDTFDSELIQTVRALAADRAALFEAHGMSPQFRVCDVLSSRGTAVFTTEALVGPPPEDARLVGPSLRRTNDDARYDASFANGRPIVYASFGSQAWYQPARYRALAAAARTLDVSLMMAMGDLADELRPELEDAHTRCLAFAPQQQILAMARVAVTHGGANSVMEGLSHGVPLLVAPICNDQPHNCRFIEQACAGRAIDLDSASTSTISDALATLLRDGPERKGAARVAASYRERSGSHGAAALVLEQLP